MRPIRDGLLAQLAATNRGDPWYGTSRSALLEGISAGQAAAEVIPGAHSIWQLVLHMTAWTEEVGRRLAGGAPAAPRAGDWPAPGAVSDTAWADAKADLERAAARLRDAAAALTDDEWGARVGATRDAPLGAGITMAEMIVGLAEHDAYHTGQIALLRRAAGW